MRLLVVEDERYLLDILKKRLTREHYSVDACMDGNSAWDYIQLADYDGIILDIMLPGMDGITILKKLRAAGKQMPVLLLTARDSIEDRVKGLDAGADDYLVKPFAFEELLARIRVMLRRTSNAQKEEENKKAQNDAKEEIAEKLPYERTKRVRLYADTMEELLEKIREIDWNAVKPDSMKADPAVQAGSIINFEV